MLSKTDVKEVGRKVQGLDSDFRQIITQSEELLEKLNVIDNAAKTDASVLILGESGVGKELFAQRIHRQSGRRDFPFVTVNCAALSGSLMESELFGHVKGAFTSAAGERAGRFEAANGGTIFFDEIGEIPLAMQAKLLRVLQQRSFEKVGSDLTITVDVRILAATNVDIEKEVERGAFRRDLYYRLNVIPVSIPPLRARLKDVPHLARFFLEGFSQKAGKTFEGFSDEALQSLIAHDWPGNVRELENCIERACITSAGGFIQAGDLQIRGAELYYRGEPGDRDLKNAVNVFKANFIRKVLKENGWNQSRAATALGIQRTYLSRLLKELKSNKLTEQ
ncbi:MAG: sigma 54-interacting transcriptional regulator [Spirochaetes bacterium]|nr:sigma 54-interacting transcriptional regulator [Spirochaetota bacterium]